MKIRMTITITKATTLLRWALLAVLAVAIAPMLFTFTDARNAATEP